jgi:hypothetical protein
MRVGRASCSFWVHVFAQASDVTFNRDVLPVLQNRSQACHLPGEVAPMVLLTYKGRAPLGCRAMRQVVTQKMPPWHADPGYGKFLNERRLTQAEKVHALQHLPGETSSRRLNHPCYEHNHGCIDRHICSRRRFNY